MNIHIFKKSNSLKKKNLEIDIDFYWKIILYVTFFLIIASALFGFYLFSNVNKDTSSSVDANLAQVGKVKKDRIHKALEYFTEKENKSKSILNSATPVVDPSR